MKTRLTFTLAILTLVVGSGLTVTAQQSRTKQQELAQQERRQQEPAQQERSLIPELAAPRELAPESIRAEVPRECRGIRPDIQMHDVADKFTPPGTPASLSPALAAYLTGKPLKGYDDKRINMVFADSFKLRSCRVCYATLEVGVRHDQELWSNDKIYVQAAPYAPNGVNFIYTGIWSSSSPNPNTLNFALPTAALNNYLFSTSTIPTFLDVFAQDDTDFDYVKLSVWYY